MRTHPPLHADVQVAVAAKGKAKPVEGGYSAGMHLDCLSEATIERFKQVRGKLLPAPFPESLPPPPPCCPTVRFEQVGVGWPLPYPRNARLARG